MCTWLYLFYAFDLPLTVGILENQTAITYHKPLCVNHSHFKNLPCGIDKDLSYTDAWRYFTHISYLAYYGTDLFDLIQCIAQLDNITTALILFRRQITGSNIYREHYYRNNTMSVMASLLCYNKVMLLCNYRSWIGVQINVTPKKIWTGQVYKSPWKTAVKRGHASQSIHRALENPTLTDMLFN